MSRVPTTTDHVVRSVAVALVALTLRAQLAWHDARHSAALRAVERHQTGMSATLENAAMIRRTLAAGGAR